MKPNKKETSQILQLHMEKYPLLQPIDLIKLLYQNEFGGGHMIADAAQSLSFIKQEYALVPHGATEPFEALGNGMLRVYLTGIDINNYSLEQLNHDFVLSASMHTGSMTTFHQTLEWLISEEFALQCPFSGNDLKDYIYTYQKQGCQMVSHSPVYKDAYHPAYRVVMEDLIRNRF